MEMFYLSLPGLHGRVRLHDRRVYIRAPLRHLQPAHLPDSHQGRKLNSPFAARRGVAYVHDLRMPDKARVRQFNLKLI